MDLATLFLGFLSLTSFGIGGIVLADGALAARRARASQRRRVPRANARPRLASGSDCASCPAAA